MTDPRMTPTNDAPVTVERRAIFEAIRWAWFDGRASTRDGEYDSEAVEAKWNQRIDRLAALASAPASQEAAFRAGAEAMQRALADALRDHLNSRAAAIANSTPLPEYPA